MINEVSYLKKPHHKLQFVEILFSILEDKYLKAILTESKQQRIYKRKLNDSEVAGYLAISVHTYRHRKDKAFEKIGKQLMLLDEYDKVAWLKHNYEIGVT